MSSSKKSTLIIERQYRPDREACVQALGYLLKKKEPNPTAGPSVWGGNDGKAKEDSADEGILPE